MTKEQDYDIVIIGGGLAGLTAARELSGQGLRLAIVEAKDRLGGRTWFREFQEWKNPDSKNWLLEMGGGWVYWTQPHVWAEITRYNLELFERPGWPKNYDAPIYVLVDGEVVTNPMAENMAQLFPLVEEFADVARYVFPKPFDPHASMEQIKEYDHLSNAGRLELLNTSPLQRTMLNRLLSMQSHSNLHDGGYVEFLRWFALSHFNMETYLASPSKYQFLEGTQVLIDALLGDCEADIHLNCPVETVHQDAHSVSITTKNGQVISADKAILALPIKVLDTINFSPALDASKQALSKERHSGTGQKIYVLIAGHWPDLNCAADADAPLSTVLVQEAREEETLLVVFTVNDQIQPISKASLQAALRIFVPEIEVLNFTHHNWVADPYSLGTWCGYRPKQTSNYLADAQASEGRLHFAGSDIANGWRGFMDGAIESGLKVANAIKQLK